MEPFEELEYFCMKCMRKKEDKDGICPYCHFDLKAYNSPTKYLQPGVVLDGTYMVGMPLGRPGGFGITYIGKDLKLKATVAIKEYAPSGLFMRNSNGNHTILSDQNKEAFEKGRKRFLDEARTLAKFDGREGIVSVKTIFEENDTAYLVMEYVDGEDFGTYIEKQGGKLSASLVFQMMKPVMRTLDEIHKDNVIHRDISPENIMVTKKSKMKLIDFGAAKDLTNVSEQTLSVILKQGYAPEEQYQPNGKQGAWTDVYALCATMYRAITGQKPENALERREADTLKRPSQLGILIEEEQEKALMKGLAVRAKDRWQSVGQLYHALFREEVAETTDASTNLLDEWDDSYEQNASEQYSRQGYDAMQYASKDVTEWVRVEEEEAYDAFDERDYRLIEQVTARNGIDFHSNPVQSRSNNLNGTQANWAGERKKQEEHLQHNGGQSLTDIIKQPIMIGLIAVLLILVMIAFVMMTQLI